MRNEVTNREAAFYKSPSRRSGARVERRSRPRWLCVCVCGLSSMLSVCMLSVLALVDVDETCFTPSREGGQGTDHNSLFVAALGTDAPLQPLVPRHVKKNAEDVSSALHVLKEDGAVLLSNVVDPEAAVALRVCYDSKLLGGPTVHEAMEELAALNSSNAFYMAERKIEGLRIRRNGARGRYDLKSTISSMHAVPVQSIDVTGIDATSYDIFAAWQNFTVYVLKSIFEV